MNIEDLDGMSEKQVKQVANDLGVKIHHKHSKETVIAKIKDHMDGEVEDEDDQDDSEDEGEASLEIQSIVSSEKTKPEDTEKIAEKSPTAVQTFNPNAVTPKLATWPTPDQVQEALKSHIARGLKIVQMTDEYWHFQIENREDSGNMKMPLGQFVMVANILLRPARTARNDGSSA